VDVGANIGYFTVLFSRLVGEKGHVFAFEPDPQNMAILRRNLETNGCRNVTVEAKAVGDRLETVRLYRSTEVLGDHRIYDSGDGRESLPVEAIPLDQYFADYRGRIDAVKMDIQGAELLALKGMSATLDRNPAVWLLMEFWPYGLHKAGTNPEAVVQFLERKGFQLSDVRTPARRVGHGKLARLIRKQHVEGWSHVDLFCSRGESAAA
jgi:FkbM family methyltransferase